MPGVGPHRLLALVVALFLVVGVTACGDDDDGDGAAAPDDAELAADADAPDAGDGDGDGDDGSHGEGDEPLPADVDPCPAFADVAAIDDARGSGDPEAAESRRQEALARLVDVLGPDAPAGVLDAIDALARLHVVGDPPDDGDDLQTIEVANESLYGYLGPICGLGDDLGSDVGAGVIGPVTLGGVGAVSIGMAIDDAAAEIGFDTTTEGFAEESESCASMDPDPNGPYDGLAFMVFDDAVQRIDVVSGGWVTPSGIGLGASDAELDAAYGDALERSPHAYVEDGSYVEFVPSDPGNDGLTLVFEVVEGEVTTFRAGFIEPARYVEGCA